MYPSTIAISKQLVGVYDKPLIYYPLSTLVSVGIQNITIVVSPEGQEPISKLLRDGRNLGLSLSYVVQLAPNGIADAINCVNFKKATKRIVVILGDNIFAGQGYLPRLRGAMKENSSAHVFVHRVSDAREYGVATIGPNGEIASLEEKPSNPKSNWAVTGLYVYPRDCIECIPSLKPSARSEIEVTDLNLLYLSQGRLRAHYLGKNCEWFDVGNPDALLRAAWHIRSVQKLGRSIIGSPEIAALRSGLIKKSDLKQLIRRFPESYYKRKIAEFA